MNAGSTEKGVPYWLMAFDWGVTPHQLGRLLIKQAELTCDLVWTPAKIFITKAELLNRVPRRLGKNHRGLL
jgi:hypothetical protein